MPKQFKGIAADFVNAMKTYFVGRGANPNDIIVQDLFNYNPPSNQGSLKALNSLKEAPGILDEMQAMSQEDRTIIQTLLAVYNENIQTKREILTQARNLFETSDIVKIIIDVMIDDGFNSFQNEKEEFKIEYILEEEELQDLGEEFQQQVQNHIDEFVDKFALKTKVADMVPELLRDGEYAFGVLFDENNKKGITDIIDDLDVINLIPFYENNKLAFVINQNNFQDSQDNNNTFIGNFGFTEEKPIAYKPDNIVFFRLDGNTKKRINMSCFYNTEFKKLFYTKTGIRLPKYVRIALPIFYNAMGYLNRLKIMDNVASVLDLNDILKPEIVTVNVPTNTSGPEANRIVRNFERQLNDLSVLENGELDFSTLCAQANRRKVLPVWMDTKGTVTSANVNQTAKGQGAWDATDKLRNLIALDIGVPPYYVNVSATPMEKSQTIKLYSRYTRKLTALQKSVAEGIKDFLMIDLEHCGLNVSRSNLSVKFKAITSGDTLDDTDMLVALATGLGDLYKALDEITSSDHNNLVLDNEQFKQLYDDITGKYLNVANLIKIDNNKFLNIDGQDGDFTPIGSPSGRSGSEPGSAPVNVNVNTNSGGGEESYADFVDASNDIGVPGTEPAIEEI